VSRFSFAKTWEGFAAFRPFILAATLISAPNYSPDTASHNEYAPIWHQQFTVFRAWGLSTFEEFFFVCYFVGYLLVANRYMAAGQALCLPREITAWD
jgi:hypothetical protein